MAPGRFPHDSPGAVLQMIRRGEVHSRSEIAREAGISPSTAAARVLSLIEHGYVRESGDGRAQGGRRPRRLELRSDAGCVATADLGSRHATLGLFALDGSLVQQRHVALRIDQGPDPVLQSVVEQVRDMVEQAGHSSLRGVTVGVPGPVDSRTERVVSPSRMPGWNGVDVAAVMSQLMGVPALVDNDANLMASGEYHSAAVPEEHLVFVKAGTGIGCGVICDGRVHRGHRGAAGDISHVAVSAGGDVLCSCGRIGCLDAVASGAALAVALASTGYAVSDTAGVVALARDANPDAARLLREAGRLTGEVLATIVNFFNPDAVVVGGQLSQAEPYVASLRSTLFERCLPMASEELSVRVSAPGASAAIIGGCHLMLEHLFDPAQVNERIDSEAAGPRAAARP